MIPHIIGGDDPKPMRFGEPVQSIDPGAIIAFIKIADSDISKRGQRMFEPIKPSLEMIKLRAGQGNKLNAFAVPDQIIKSNIAGPFRLPCAVYIRHFTF